MVNLFKNTIFFLLLIAMGLPSCKGPEKKETNDEKIEAGTPVTVTTIGADALTEYTDLNATATFLQKNYVKANVNGYIQSVNAAPGKFVSGGQTLFIIKTKKPRALIIQLINWIHLLSSQE